MLYFLVSALAVVCRFLSVSLYHSPVPLLMKAAHESSVSAIERLDLRIVCLHRKNADWAVFVDCCRKLRAPSRRENEMLSTALCALHLLRVWLLRETL